MCAAPVRLDAPALCVLRPRDATREAVNDLPRSKTLSDLREKVRYMDMPHESYDIDGDGIVSHQDMFLAKRFDLDGNGVLDSDEQEVGRRVLAHEFFKVITPSPPGGCCGDDDETMVQ